MIPSSSLNKKPTTTDNKTTTMIVPYVECAISRDRLFTVATHHTQNQSFGRAGAKNEKVMQGEADAYG